MRKISLLFALVCLLGNAAQIDEQQAAEIARKYLPATAAKSMARVHPGIDKSQPAESDAEYYVFNAGNDEGFVIISGDDELTELIGYSDSGYFSSDNLPDNLKNWLLTYSEYVDNVREGVVSPRKDVVAIGAEAVVAPLVETQWNQDLPFCSLCPTAVYDNQTYVCPTGCVATAFAQMMKFWEWPKQGKGSHSYRNRYRVEKVDFSQSVYDWDNMIPNYNGSYTKAQADAVAKLMYDCGVAVDMQYDLSASGAMDNCVPYAAAEYFGYDSEFIPRDATFGTQFADRIKEELNAGRPVMFCGVGAAGGHAYVVDGYDTNQYVHVNWGWGGVSDGYYSIDLMNPSSLGIGGGGGGFVYNQSIITFVPDYEMNGSYSQMSLNIADLSNSNYEDGGFSAKSNSVKKGDSFIVELNGLATFGNTSYDGFAGVGIFDANGKLMAEPVDQIPIMFRGNAWIYTSAFDFDLKEELKNLPDGDYTVKAVSKEQRDGEAFDWICVATTHKVPLHVEGENVTVSYPKLQLELTSSIEVVGKAVLGDEASLKVSLHNPTTEKLSGKAKFIVYDNGAKRRSFSSTITVAAMSDLVTEIPFTVSETTFKENASYEIRFEEFTLDLTGDFEFEFVKSGYDSCEFTAVTENGGIESVNSATGIKVYPNPAVSSVNVDSESPVLEIKLYSANGALVKSVSGENTIDVADCAPGFYVISVATAKETIRKQLIVKR